MACLTEETARAYAAGTPTPAEEADAQRQLASGEECRQLVAIPLPGPADVAPHDEEPPKDH